MRACIALSHLLLIATLQSTRHLCPWHFPDKNTRMDCHFLFQGIFLIQGLNPHPLHWQAGSLLLSHLGRPQISTVGYNIQYTMLLACMLLSRLCFPFIEYRQSKISIILKGPEIKRYLLLGKKVMTNLDSILKNKDITLSTKVCLVKAMVFPVVMYGCESQTVKKADH